MKVTYRDADGKLVEYEAEPLSDGRPLGIMTGDDEYHDRIDNARDENPFVSENERTEVEDGYRV